MRVKSAYRDKPPEAEKAPEGIPAEAPEPKVEIDGAPAAPDAAVEIEEEAQPEPKVVAAIDAAAEADYARLALKRQIEALQQSEALQRQHQEAAQTAMQQTPRERKLASWKAAGMPERDLSFLSQHPEMVDHDAITGAASQDVLSSGTPYEANDYPQKVKEAFDRRLNQLRRQAAAPSPPMPEFFRPPPARQESEMPSESHMVSAPVSRQAPSPSGGYQPAGSGRVTLSPEEQAIAQASGISLREYAEGKLKLEREKRSGLRQ